MLFAGAQLARSVCSFKKKVSLISNLFTAQCKKSRLGTINCLINWLTDKDVYIFEEILV